VRGARWRRPRVGPPARLSGAGLERADRQLLRVLDRDFRAAAGRAGERLACGPGCSECCIGPFPITRLDAWRLHAGLAGLASADPARAEEVRERARRAVERLAEGYPGDRLTGRLRDGEEALDSFFERHGSLPCPALEPDSGRCELYAGRPVSCRTYGPPAKFGDERVPPCRLCFTGAPAEQVEACRIEPDREGLEERILAGMGVAGGEDWETLVAFALLH
jgi:Fe-S-cluster containining protein